MANITLKVDIVNQVKEMNDIKAKELLTDIFSKLMKVNENNYTEEQCFHDIEQIYKQFVTRDN